jgi:hypothetical protein
VGLQTPSSKAGLQTPSSKDNLKFNMKLKNLILTFLMILSASIGGTKAYIDYLLRQELNTSIQSVANQVTLNYADIRTSWLGAVILKDLDLILANSDEPLHIETIRLDKAYQFHNLTQWPTNMQLSLTNLRYPINDISSPPPVIIASLGYAPYYLTPKELRSLGYLNINADIALQVQTSLEKVAITGVINAQAWGDFNFILEFNQLPSPQQWTISTFKSIQLLYLKFSYIDNGFFNRVFTWLAQRNKMTLARFKQTLLTQLSHDFNSTQEIGSNVLNPLLQFIQNPRQLTLYLRPDLPIVIEALGQVPLKQLGLTIATD